MYLKNIQHKIKENNAMITYADKGKTPVIINTHDYHNKVHIPNKQQFPSNPKKPHQ